MMENQMEQKLENELEIGIIGLNQLQHVPASPSNVQGLLEGPEVSGWIIKELFKEGKHEFQKAFQLPYCPKLL